VSVERVIERIMETATQATTERVYGAGEFSVRVSTNCDLLLECLSRHVYYKSLGPTKATDWSLIAVQNYEVYSENRVLFAEFNGELEYRDPASVFLDRGIRLVVPFKTRSLILVDPEQRRVIIVGFDFRGMFVDSYKALRGIFTSLAFLDGWTCVHASGVTVGNQAVLFVGDEGAGKTTAVLHAMDLGIPGMGFLGNDRIWLTRHNTGMLAVTWPSVLTMGLGSIESVPRLRERLGPALHLDAGGIAMLLLDLSYMQRDVLNSLARRIESGEPQKKAKQPLTPAEVSRVFGVDLVPEGSLMAIVLLVSSDQNNCHEVVRISPAQALEGLTPNILGSIPNHGDWLGILEASQVRSQRQKVEVSEVLNRTPVIYRVITHPSRLRISIQRCLADIGCVCPR